MARMVKCVVITTDKALNPGDKIPKNANITYCLKSSYTGLIVSFEDVAQRNAEAERCDEDEDYATELLVNEMDRLSY